MHPGQKFGTFLEHFLFHLFFDINIFCSKEENTLFHWSNLFDFLPLHTLNTGKTKSLKDFFTLYIYKRVAKIYNKKTIWT